MAKVMWLGEDIGDVPGPSFTTCYGLKFRKDVNVEINDENILRKARGNLMFKVTEGGPQPKQERPKQEVMLKQEAEQYDTSGARDVTPKQETHDAQTKAQGLADKAQELKAKVEGKDYDYRKAEKGSGYSPVKKKKEKGRARVSHTRHSAGNDAA